MHGMVLMGRSFKMLVPLDTFLFLCFCAADTRHTISSFPLSCMDLLLVCFLGTLHFLVIIFGSLESDYDDVMGMGDAIKKGVVFCGKARITVVLYISSLYWFFFLFPFDFAGAWIKAIGVLELTLRFIVGPLCCAMDSVKAVRCGGCRRNNG